MKVITEELKKIFNLTNCYIDFSGSNSEILEAITKKGSFIVDNSCYLALDINKLVSGVLVLEGFKNKPDFSCLKFIASLISEILSQGQNIHELQESNTGLLHESQVKSQLICTVSHELRTPMANILGFSELLTTRNYEAKTQEKYNLEIHNSALRLSALIDNFLDLSRIETLGQIQLGHFEEVELDFIAETAWEELNSINQNHIIEWQIIRPLPNLICDSDAIKRVFINLFSNAIKYSRQSENLNANKIVCSIQMKDGAFLVSIKDHGSGIPEEAIENIFEKFYRVDNKETAFISGTGLGLWICREIIQAHQGRIWCESTLNKGSCFHFTLGVNHEK